MKHKKDNPVAALAEAPARIRPTHVQNRFVSTGDRKPGGWSNTDWPIQIAYENGRLSERGSSDNANARWLAIREYSEIYELALCRSGRDSTDLDVVSGGSGFPISEAMSDAIKKLISIDSHMSQKDRKIVRKLCEGYSLPGSVRAACGDDFIHTVAARVRDALDGLSDAIVNARNSGFRYVRMGGLDFCKI